MHKNRSKTSENQNVVFTLCSKGSYFVALLEHTVLQTRFTKPISAVSKSSHQQPQRPTDRPSLFPSSQENLRVLSAAAMKRVRLIRSFVHRSVRSFKSILKEGNFLSFNSYKKSQTVDRVKWTSNPRKCMSQQQIFGWRRDNKK